MNEKTSFVPVKPMFRTEIPSFEPIEGDFWLHLGTNSVLSRAEVKPFAKTGLFHEIPSVLELSDLLAVNIRKIPRKPAQLFLDRLGGAKMLTKVLHIGLEYQEMGFEILQLIQKGLKDTKLSVYIGGIEIYGSDVAKFIRDLKKNLSREEQNRVRFVNLDGKKWETGKLFGEKVMKKGLALQIWAKDGGYSVGKVEAIQNIRNYTLRDHKKPFRDAKMGMLPPKLAQMLVNFAFLGEDIKTFKPFICDAFCGSGTVNAEAAIMGYKTNGSDLEAKNVAGARENWTFLSEKFRFSADFGAFSVADAQQRDYSADDVLVTEGFLGTPMEKTPAAGEIFNEQKHILTLWEGVFQQMLQFDVKKMIFCIPAWRKAPESPEFYSFRSEMYALAEQLGYKSVVSTQNIMRYARKDAVVAREVFILKKV